jgi:hypothetical protein
MEGPGAAAAEAAEKEIFPVKITFQAAPLRLAVIR